MNPIVAKFYSKIICIFFGLSLVLAHGDIPFSQLRPGLRIVLEPDAKNHFKTRKGHECPQNFSSLRRADILTVDEIATRIIFSSDSCIAYSVNETDTLRGVRIEESDALKKEAQIKDEYQLQIEAASSDITPTSILGIQFGTKLNQVKTKLAEKQYPMASLGQNQYLIEKVKLGKLNVKIIFFFNSKSSFYRYVIMSQGYIGQHFNSDVVPASNFLTEVLKISYGEPKNRLDPVIINVLAGRHRKYWTWFDINHQIYTGFGVNANQYYALASITNIQYAREGSGGRKQERNTSIERGAEAF
jgi:hypothetical protein